MSRVIMLTICASAFLPASSVASRREIVLGFEGPNGLRCAKAAVAALNRDKGVAHVTLDARTSRAFVEFDTARFATADVNRVATADRCSANVIPFHVRAKGAEIRIGIGPDDAYIHPKSRLAVSLTAPKRVKVPFSVLDRSHATYINDPDRATFMTFTVDAKASRAGRYRIRARVVFFYCDETICEKRESTVWPIVTIPKR